MFRCLCDHINKLHIIVVVILICFTITDNNKNPIVNADEINKNPDEVLKKALCPTNKEET